MRYVRDSLSLSRGNSTCPAEPSRASFGSPCLRYGYALERMARVVNENVNSPRKSSASDNVEIEI